MIDGAAATVLTCLKDRKLYTVDKPATWPLLAPLIGDRRNGGHTRPYTGYLAAKPSAAGTTPIVFAVTAIKLNEKAPRQFLSKSGQFSLNGSQ
jgi:hypothetical protein